jgi:hypothetical protein
MDTATIIRAIIVVFVFYFIGRLVNKTPDIEKKETSKVSISEDEIGTLSNNTDNIELFTQILIVSAIILTVLYGVINVGKSTPEEQTEINMNKQILLNKIKRCESVVNKSIIDPNDDDFRKCATFLEDLHNNTF